MKSAVSTKIETPQQLISDGLCIIPIKDKVPTVRWKEYQTRLPGLNELIYGDSFGLVCGKVSGGVEAIDVDIKNDPTGTLINRLYDAIEEHGPDIGGRNNLVVQNTPSGGIHLLYRCETVGPNQVLAKSKDMKPLIETRGEGGYIAIAPSPGYELTEGQFSSIPTIAAERRDEILDACRSLNESFVVIKEPWTKGSTDDFTPWGDYNKRADVSDLLEGHSWMSVNSNGANQRWRRPGKDRGHSASWNEELRLFYCFTSSTALQPNKAYTATALFAFLECNGNFSDASSKLYSLGYGRRRDCINTAQLELPSREDIRMTFKYAKKNDEPALTLKGITLINFGEIFTLVGLPGRGKSAICECIVCAHLGKGSLGFKFNSKGKKALFIDTERPPDEVYDSYHNISKRLVSPALDNEGEIHGLVHLALSSFSKVADLKAILELELGSGEFDLVILDGIIDFCLSMNDERDTAELVRWVRMLAVKYNCALVVTIHPNKGSETIAGHLGSFLYRWCRAILYVRTVKGDPSVKELTGKPEMSKLSHGELGSLDPVYFNWDSELKLLVECKYTPTVERGLADKMNAAFTNVLGGGKRLRYGDLLNALVDAGHAKSTAKRWITKATAANVIHSSDGRYSIN